MLLKDKVAVIFGAGGSLGGSIAYAFAREGARVFVSGRTLESATKVADKIVAEGGISEPSTVDALDKTSVNDYVKSVVEKAGRIDICFNAIALLDKQGLPLSDMSLEDFTRPISRAMQSHFLTSTAVARQMLKQATGVILFLTATPAGMSYEMVGGFGPASSAMEAFSRNLAAELGPNGIRVVCIRSAGSPDSAVFVKSIESNETPAKTAIQGLIDDTMLKKLPLMADVANVAVFAASDLAAGLTGTTINVTCGTTMD